MKVSFHGFKNVGFLGTGSGQYTKVRGGVLPPHSQTWGHVELTNKNGNELDEYKDILEKYPNPSNPNALNIRSYNIKGPFGYYHNLYVNDKFLDLNNQNHIEDMKKIGTLMNKINKTAYNDIEYNENYFKSKEVIKAFERTYEDCIITTPYGNRYFLNGVFDKNMEEAHGLVCVREGSKVVAKNIQDDIDDFLES